ncbi:MAG: 4-hydroxy-tetrahydrodipicolinate synthase [Thermacetogeniaceae bacterium]
MAKFGRLLTAMVTPFTSDGEVAYQEAAKLALFLIENGSDGVVVAGTTGESPVLTKEEKLKLFSVVKEAVGEKGFVIAGTGSNNTADTVALTKKAAETGVDGVMVVTPYYNKPSQEGLYQHFKAVAEATDLPIIMYNVPGRTSVNLQPATVIRLAEFKNICALKEASGNLDQVAEIKRGVPENFMIYSGDDSLILPMLAVGGCGVISVASHIAGKMIKEMIENFFSGKVEEAAKLHLKLYPLFKAMFITTNPVPVKAALNLIGLNVGNPRLPLVPATEKEIETIRKVMEEIGIK